MEKETTPSQSEWLIMEIFWANDTPTMTARENNPGWKPGDAFDTNILNQLDGTLGWVDFKA